MTTSVRRENVAWSEDLSTIGGWEGRGLEGNGGGRGRGGRVSRNGGEAERAERYGLFARAVAVFARVVLVVVDRVLLRHPFVAACY